MQNDAPSISSAGHRRGFTLIEALATIVVLVVSLPVIIDAFTTADRVAIRARQRAEATAIGQSVMEQVIAEQTWQNSPLSGAEKHREMEYTWNASVQNWADAASQSSQVVPVSNVQELDVTVEWMFENQQQQLLLSSLIYQPNNTMTSQGTAVGGMP